MKAPARRRGRGRPPALRSSGLCERAWWLMREVRRFTLDDLLYTLVRGTERDAPSNLLRYIGRLERVGVLRRLERRAPGRAPKSNGHVVWTLARDLGRAAPVWREAERALWDANAGVLLRPEPGAAPGTDEASGTAGVAA
jgi:hypothetical protein